MSIGASAKSILAHLLGGYEQDGSYPHDAADFGRCEKQLMSNPLLWPKFHKMAEVNAYWAALVPRWLEIRALEPEKRTALIKSILAPIQKADPLHAQFGPNASITVGPITFKGEAAKEDEEDTFTQAVMLVWSEGVVSTSRLQRRLEIGYNAAARLIERMEEMAIVSKPDHVGKRTVRSPDDLRAALNIRQEITDIAGEQWGPILLKALVAGLKEKPQQEKTSMAGTGHNSGDVTAAYTVTADELRQFIERAEQLASEKKDVAEQEKELFAEAKGRGYDTKVMRKVIALRKRKPDEIAEEEAIIEMYKSALGMQ